MFAQGFQLQFCVQGLIVGSHHSFAHHSHWFPLSSPRPAQAVILLDTILLSTILGKEPSWHILARKRRSHARSLLQAAAGSTNPRLHQKLFAAAQLVQQHHGSSVPMPWKHSGGKGGKGYNWGQGFNPKHTHYAPEGYYHGMGKGTSQTSQESG